MRGRILGPVIAGAALLALLISGCREPAETLPGTLETHPPVAAHPTVPNTEPVETALPTETTEPVETTRPEAPWETEEAPTYPETEPTTLPRVEEEIFPVELEGGMLLIRSIFPFSGMNPDGGNQYSEDLAVLQMTNTSQEHLLYAEVSALLADGTSLTFRAEDVPPGKSVMAFSLENAALEGRENCEDIDGYAEFQADPAELLRPDLVEVSVRGSEITVKNISGKNLDHLDVYCHGLLDTSYYGGTTYHYTITGLKAGKTATIQATDCFLGLVEVVRIAHSD